MTLSRSVLAIVNDPNPGVTEIRKHSKETIITALLEMKRIFSDQALEIRRIDLEMAKMTYELKKMEMNHKMKVSEGILVYGAETKEHRYGPKYSGEVSSNLATLWTGNSEGVTPLLGSKDHELEQRVETAKSQGMRWNLQDKRPERNSTVIRKLNEWESAVDRGLKADLDLYTKHNHKKLMEMEGVCKGFVVGLCMQMEQKMGIGPSSVYLAPRYNRNSEKYRQMFAQTAVEPVPVPEPTVSPEDQAKQVIDQIYTEWLGSDYRTAIRKYDESAKVEGTEHLRKMFAKHTEMLVTLDPDDRISDRWFGVKVLWDITQPYIFDLIQDNIDWETACQREMQYITYANVHQTYRNSPERMEDMFYEWWKEMCERVGLGR